MCFRLHERNARATIEDLDLEAGGLKNLKPGQFAAVNLFTGGRPDGRMF
jgi:hypothetical protein